MKTILAFSIALLLQTISAASTASATAENPSSSSNSSPLDSAAAAPTVVGDKMAQEMLEKYVVFRWENNNTFAQESFEFQLNEPTMLQVVDFKHHGDMFDVYDNGKQIGSSSKVVYDEDVETYAATPQEALTDDHFSKGSFNLDKGQHNITILAHGPYDAGSAAVRLVQRTNLVLAKGEQEKQPKEQEEEKKANVEKQDEKEEEEEVEEEEKEEEEEEEEEKEDTTVQKKKSDHDNWKKMFLKKRARAVNISNTEMPPPTLTKRSNSIVVNNTSIITRMEDPHTTETLIEDPKSLPTGKLSEKLQYPMLQEWHMQMKIIDSRCIAKNMKT
ncbi:hypothetical protein BCR42DRAFT_99033 [Absidia repens]|uniref:Uncharacterized protein n=1 Tax=Absidia repens TaxID=90262 RepID=A0A1X2I9E4_9FUNG|nr:hypothetical protein BCR42DRAFT_99033 [Absidia repens]